MNLQEALQEINELKEYITDLKEENENQSEYICALVERIKELENV